MKARLVSLALATLAAIAAWLTLGLQTVIGEGTRVRLGVLPAWWLLGALVAAFAGVVWWRQIAAARLWPLALTGLVCLPWLPGPIQGDERARGTVTTVRLRPRRIGDAPGARPALVQRASRYGRARIFFFDDNAFVERPGFWTRGDSAADVFVDPAPPGLFESMKRRASLRLRAGPVASSIDLSSGDWRQVVTLEPGAETVIQLPDGHRSGWPLRLETRAAFRPAQHDGKQRHAQSWDLGGGGALRSRQKAGGTRQDAQQKRLPLCVLPDWSRSSLRTARRR